MYMFSKIMRKGAAKGIAIALCAAAFAAALTGCRAMKSNNIPATTLTLAAQSDVIQFFDGTGLTAYFNSAANIDIKWIDYGSGADIVSEINDTAAGKPDAYLGMGLSAADFSKVNPGTFLDLSTRLEQTTNLKNIVANNPDMAAALETNGQLLSFPTFYQDYSSEYPAKMWINSQWLTDSGLPMPTTADELENVLLQFQADANQNGLSDEIPMTAAYQGGYYNTLGFLVSAFCPTQFDLSANSSYLSVDPTGKVYTEVTTQHFKAALTYIKKLMDEGLLDPNIFTNTPQSLLAGSASAETYGVLPAPDLNALWNSPTRAAGYVPIPPLTSSVSSQTYSAPYPQLPSTGGYMIAASSNNIDAALRFGDAMLSQNGTLSILYGTNGWQSANGQTYDDTTASWQPADGATPVKPLPNIHAAIPYWYDSGVMAAQQVSNSGGTINLQTAANWQLYLNQVTEQDYEPAGKPYLDSIYPQLALAPADVTQNGVDVRSQVQQYLVSTCQAFITGQMDLDTQWDEFVNTLHDKGLDLVISAAQSSLDAYNSSSASHSIG